MSVSAFGWYVLISLSYFWVLGNTEKGGLTLRFLHIYHEIGNVIRIGKNIFVTYNDVRVTNFNSFLELFFFV